jgi:hypothetical protein
MTAARRLNRCIPRAFFFSLRTAVPIDIRIFFPAQDGHAEIESMHYIARGLGGSTRIMAASIRDVDSLARLAAAGACANRQKEK